MKQNKKRSRNEQLIESVVLRITCRTYRTECLQQQHGKHRREVQSENRWHNISEEIEVRVTDGDDWADEGVSLQARKPRQQDSCNCFAIFDAVHWLAGDEFLRPK